MTQRRCSRIYEVLAMCLGLAACTGAESRNQVDDADSGTNGPARPGPGRPGNDFDDPLAPLPECEDDAGPDLAPRLQTHTIQLWPPNHKLHEIAVEDCVSVLDPCDRGLRPEFVWASSDEPIDAQGDGHHAPDIVLSDDCRVVSVRSERQGPENGRVYRLGVRAVDRDGYVVEAECRVEVVHDQRGTAAADSGEAYRVHFDGQGAGPSCDGVPTTPPPPPPPPAWQDAGRAPE